MLRQADFVVAHCAAFDRGFVERLMPSSRDTTWLCSRDGIDWWAKGFESRSLDDLAFAHDIENLRPHHASGDVATLLALLSYRPRRRKPYLYELLATLACSRCFGRKKPDDDRTGSNSRGLSVAAKHQLFSSARRLPNPRPSRNRAHCR